MPSDGRSNVQPGRGIAPLSVRGCVVGLSERRDQLNITLGTGALQVAGRRKVSPRRESSVQDYLKKSQQKGGKGAREVIVSWIFHRNGKAIKDWRKAWKKACTNGGVPGRIPHNFRRTAVRNLERAGVFRSVPMKLTGHKTESVYRQYAIVSESDLTESVAKLAALHQAGTECADSPRVVAFPE